MIYQAKAGIIDTTKITQTYTHKTEGWTSFAMNDGKVVRLTQSEVEELRSLSSEPIGGFWDAQCPKCKIRVGWRGTFKDRPPCHRCGYIVSVKDMEADEREIEDFKRLLEGRFKKGKQVLPDDDDELEEQT
jgi:hypothetical protein